MPVKSATPLLRIVAALWIVGVLALYLWQFRDIIGALAGKLWLS